MMGIRIRNTATSSGPQQKGTEGAKKGRERLDEERAGDLLGGQA
jgi:hypothetical protein